MYLKLELSNVYSFLQDVLCESVVSFCFLYCEEVRSAGSLWYLCLSLCWGLSVQMSIQQKGKWHLRVTMKIVLTPRMPWRGLQALEVFADRTLRPTAQRHVRGATISITVQWQNYPWDVFVQQKETIPAGHKERKEVAHSKSNTPDSNVQCWIQYLSHTDGNQT